MTVPNSDQHRLERLFGLVNVLAKENRHDRAIEHIERARGEFKGDSRYYDRALLFALGTRNAPLITTLTDDNLTALCEKDAFGQALECCRRSMSVLKNFRPRSPAVCHALAEEAYARNLAGTALVALRASAGVVRRR